MKKILALVSSLSIFTSSLATTGCSIADGVKDSIEQALSQIVNVTALAARGGVLSTVNGIDPNYTINYYGQKSIKNVLPDYNQTGIITQLLFDEMFAPPQKPVRAGLSAFTQASDLGTGPHHVDFLKGTSHPDSDGAKQFFFYTNGAASLLYSKFTPGVAEQLGSLITSPAVINNLRNSNLLDGLYKYVGNIKSFNFLHKLGKALNEDDSDHNYSWQTAINDSIIRMSNALYSLTINPIPDHFISYHGIKDLTYDLMERGNELISNSISSLLTTPNPNFWQSLLSGDAIGEIIHAAKVFLGYFGAFNLLIPETSISSPQHLFNSVLNNDDYAKTLLDQNYNPIESLNWQILFRDLSIFFTDSNKSQVKVHNLQKLFGILSAGSVTDWKHNGYINVLNSILYGFNSLIKAADTFAPTPILYTLLKSLSEDSDLGSYLINLLKLPSELYPQLKIIMGWIEDHQNWFANPFTNLYYNSDFLVGIANLANQFVPGHSDLFTGIKKLESFYHILTTPIGKLVNGFNVDLPSFLYFAQSTSLTDLLLNVDSKVMDFTDIYLTDDKLISYRIKLINIGNLLQELGTPATDTIKKAIDVGFKSDQFPLLNPWLENSSLTPDEYRANTSTLFYALHMLLNESDDNNNYTAAFGMLGCKPESDATFWTGSAFADFSNLYEDGEYRNGISKMWDLLNYANVEVNEGINTNFTDNYERYLDNKNWSFNQISEVKLNNSDVISFNLNYHNPDDNKVYQFFISIKADYINANRLYKFTFEKFIKL